MSILQPRAVACPTVFPLTFLALTIGALTLAATAQPARATSCTWDGTTGNEAIGQVVVRRSAAVGPTARWARAQLTTATLSVGYHGSRAQADNGQGGVATAKVASQYRATWRSRPPRSSCR